MSIYIKENMNYKENAQSIPHMEEKKKPTAFRNLRKVVRDRFIFSKILQRNVQRRLFFCLPHNSYFRCISIST